MNQLVHRFHWMFVPLFVPSTGAAVAVGSTVLARLAALEAYRRMGHVPSAILCTSDEYRVACDDDRLRAQQPGVDEIGHASNRAIPVQTFRGRRRGHAARFRGSGSGGMTWRRCSKRSAWETPKRRLAAVVPSSRRST